MVIRPTKVLTSWKCAVADGLPILFRFPQLGKHLLHDVCGKRLDMNDLFRDGAILAQVLIEHSPGSGQLLERLRGTIRYSLCLRQSQA